MRYVERSERRENDGVIFFAGCSKSPSNKAAGERKPEA